MAHFAELSDDGTNTVLNVIVVGNDDITVDGVEDEQEGINFLNNLFGHDRWVQSSLWTWDGQHHDQNGNVDDGTPLRGSHAAIGGTYDKELDVFVKPKEYPSWVLNTSTSNWEAPVAYVEGYIWDEDSVSWVKPEQPFPSWTWSEENNCWISPLGSHYPDEPDENGMYPQPFKMWNEETQTWDEIE